MTCLIGELINNENKETFAELSREEKRIIQQCFILRFFGSGYESVCFDCLLVFFADEVGRSFVFILLSNSIVCELRYLVEGISRVKSTSIHHLYCTYVGKTKQLNFIRSDIPSLC